MAFYDGWGKKIQQTGQEALDRTKKGAEITRLNSSINGIEKEAAKKYEELGKAYYAKHAADDTYDPDMESYFQDIDESMDQIEGYRDQIRTLKGLRKCPECGQEVSATAQYCNFCGAKLEPVVTETPAEGRVCPNCGAPIDDNQAFCTVCGTNVENVPCSEEVVVEEIVEEVPESKTE